MSLILGLAGASRNGAVALCDDGRVVAFCEQERVTRTRGAALPPGHLPVEALEAVLHISRRARADISACAVAEDAVQLAAEFPIERLDHHHGHAATAFYTSPFDDAIVLICDRHSVPDLTVWRGENSGLRREGVSWTGPGFAAAYALAAEAVGFRPEGDEHRFEALARIARSPCSATSRLIAHCDCSVQLTPDFKSSIATLLASNLDEDPLAHRANVVDGLQRRLGAVLLEVVGAIKNRFGGSKLCVGGGLFYNSYFTTLLAESGMYDRLFVPANPGNAGVAIGTALAVGGQKVERSPNERLSPFLGPEFSLHDIKAVLDNCKLSYEYLSYGQVIDRTITALVKGQLVGWFQGRMEWGPRALGNRSILASPVAPYVLENLNVFLKQREMYRAYGVAICAEDLPQYFRGPASSPFMEFEYEVLDRDLLRAVMPQNVKRLRVQTVEKSAGLFYQLLRAFGDVTGVPMLVNTSFNGFNEPIVCTPRDAIRVFYGTGLDMVVMGSLVLKK